MNKYDINNFVKSDNPVIILHEAFDGIRECIRKDVKAHIWSLKSKYDLEYALERYEAFVYRSGLIKRWQYYTICAISQLKAEFNDPLAIELIDFNLGREVQSIFKDQWRYTPHTTSGKKMPQCNR